MKVLIEVIEDQDKVIRFVECEVSTEESIEDLANRIAGQLELEAEDLAADLRGRPPAAQVVERRPEVARPAPDADLHVEPRALRHVDVPRRAHHHPAIQDLRRRCCWQPCGRAGFAW